MSIGTYNFFRCWRRAVYLCIALASCTGHSPGENSPGEEGKFTEKTAVQKNPRASAQGVDNEDTGQEMARHRYFRGYLSERLRGDRYQASKYYSELLSQKDEEPKRLARAALRLAQWKRQAGQSAEALDLAVRAGVLGADQGSLRSSAEQLQGELVASVRAGNFEFRGPKLGVALVGVSEETANAFGEAEEVLANYHRIRLQPRLETLDSSLRGKRAAMERAVRAYKVVIERGEKVALAASEFRIASIYYDFSLDLSFGLPPELSPEFAQRLRSSLRSEAKSLRKRALDSYGRCMFAAQKAGGDAKAWKNAARIGHTLVQELVR